MPNSTKVLLTIRSRRIAAALIDLASPILLAAAALYVYPSPSGSPETNIIGLAVALTNAVLPTLALLLLANLILLYKRNQTIGKKIMRIKIVRYQDFTPAPFLKILATYILLFLILFIPYYIGPLLLLINALFLFTPQRRCLHDLLADTHVIQDIPNAP